MALQDGKIGQEVLCKSRRAWIWDGKSETLLSAGILLDIESGVEFGGKRNTLRPSSWNSIIPFTRAGRRLKKDAS
jgi:hypothetical protein